MSGAMILCKTEPTSPDYHCHGTSRKVDSGQNSRLSHRHFTIAELTAVKDANFHHFAHLFSRKQKKPASEETGLDSTVRTIARYRWHESLYPAPPLPDRCPTGSPTAGELNIQL
jgi:hypothetical protein